jgi:DNA-binding response OmpR family regulator
MPGLNGFDFVSELRQRGNTAPAIMITATSSPSVERRAAEIGIQRILQKPLSGQVLLCAIREELGIGTIGEVISHTDREEILATEWRIKAVHLGNCNCAYQPVDEVGFR